MKLIKKKRKEFKTKIKKSNNFLFEPSLKEIKELNDVIKLFSFSEIINSRLSEISGGELQRVFIAMVYLRSSKIYIFDEPLNNLDIKNQIEVMNMIKKISENFQVICVLHDINIALSFCDNILLMKDGKVFDYLKACEISEKKIEEVFGIKSMVVEKEGKRFFIF